MKHLRLAIFFIPQLLHTFFLLFLTELKIRKGNIVKSLQEYFSKQQIKENEELIKKISGTERFYKNYLEPKIKLHQDLLKEVEILISRGCTILGIKETRFEKQYLFSYKEEDGKDICEKVPLIFTYKNNVWIGSREYFYFRAHNPGDLLDFEQESNGATDGEVSSWIHRTKGYFYNSKEGRTIELIKVDTKKKSNGIGEIVFAYIDMLAKKENIKVIHGLLDPKLTPEEEEQLKVFYERAGYTVIENTFRKEY